MAIQMAVFAFGSLLMLVAILGGGFEVKELKVPKVGRASRVAACACGMLFIFLGIHLDRSAAAHSPAAPSQAQKDSDVTSAALPQVVFVAALASQPAFKMDKIAERPESPSPAAVPQQPDASNTESHQEGQEIAAAPPRVRSGKAKSEGDGQATASFRTKGKQVPWEQKPRKWINRLKGKGGAR